MDIIRERIAQATRLNILASRCITDITNISKGTIPALALQMSMTSIADSLNEVEVILSGLKENLHLVKGTDHTFHRSILIEYGNLIENCACFEALKDEYSN